MTNSHATVVIMPSPPMTKNTQGQPNECVSQPMSGVKLTAEKYCAELKMAAAVPRSLPGNQVATSRLLDGNAGPSANPTAIRSTNSATIAEANPKPPTKPCRKVKNDQRKIAQA